MTDADREKERSSLAVTWGTTVAERSRGYPCDELPGSWDADLYRGVTVEAAPATVFRWLCQLRAAPYSYDWIDNRGRPSPRELTPGLEELVLGQTFMSIFELVDFEPGRQVTLVIRAPGAKKLFGDVAVSYVVEAAAASVCRLLAKLRVRYPRGAFRLPVRWLLPWGDLVMMRRQLLNLKALAERGSVA